MGTRNERTEVHKPTVARNYSRIETRGEAELLAMDQTQPQRIPVTVRLFDAGWGGFGFLSPAKLTIGSQWRALFLDGSHQVGQETFVVRHCEEVDTGLYRVGVQVVVESGLLAVLGIDRRQLATRAGSPAARRPDSRSGDV